VTTLFAFVLLLGVLVFVHELGHFLVARACGVRVLKFSIGFGPPIGIGRFRLAWHRGGTDYVVAWFPLGGFVKMLGENPEETDDPEVHAHPEESLPAQPTWKKLSIVFAGPAANLILPVVVFVGTLAVGLPRPEPVVGHVEPGSPAEQAGLAPGDHIEAVAGEPVTWWGDVQDALRARPDETVAVAYERDGRDATAQLAVGARRSFDEFGKVVEVGWAGMGHRRLAAMVGVRSADAPAAEAGLASGDVVEAVGGEPVEDWTQLRRAYAQAGSAGTVELRVRRGEGEDATHRNVRVPARGELAALGVVPANVLVAGVSPDSPALRSGLEPGDLILSVDGGPVGSFSSFAEIVRTSEGRTLHLRVARDGQVREVEVTPELIPFDAGLGIEEPRYLVGITAEVASLTGAVGVDRERNPLVAVPRAVGMTADMTRTFLQGLGKLITGEVSRRNLAGPIGIAEIAGSAFERGWETYLTILVVISINLGILNLLPIPILDGGQAVIFAVEGIRRAPLSLRTREIVQQIGLTFLVLLMGLAFWNDLSRHWADFLDWLSGSGGL